MKTILRVGAILFSALALSSFAQSPVLTSQPQSQTAALGGNFTLSVSAATGGALSLPSTPSGTLRLWLSADTGVVTNSSGQVSQWQDLSGNLNHAVQSNTNLQPQLLSSSLLQNKPAVRFDGIPNNSLGDYLHGEGDVAIPDAYTSFMVYSASAFPDSVCVPFLVGVPGGTYGADRDNCFTSSGELIFSSWAYDYPTAFIVPTNTARILEDRYDTNRTKIELFDVTGSSQTAISKNTTGESAPAAGYYVGGLEATVGLTHYPYRFAGDISEFLIYRGALSEADRSAVEAYLKIKYLTGSSVGPYTYQWRVNGTNISAATDSVLTITNAQLSDAASYDVVVCNGSGCTTSVVASVTILDTTHCLAAPSGLVGWWTGDGDTSDLVSAHSNTVSSGVTFTSGVSDQAFQFSGNGYVEVSDGPGLELRPQSLTVSGWFALNSVGGLQNMVTKVAGNGTSESYTVFMSDNLLVGVVGDASGLGNSLQYQLNPTIGQWYHFAFTFDAATKQQVLYVNGSPQASGLSGKTIGYDSHPLQLGAEYESGVRSYFMNGKLDEVALFNRALSSSEILEIYAAGTNSMCKTVPPKISSNPQSQTATVGGSATFASLAGGSKPLAYQWMLNSVPIDGATDTTYTKSNLQLSDDGGSYYLVVTNQFGTATSAAATLSVGVAPSITAQPQSLTVAQGSPATFNVGVQGSTPRYQWRFNGTALAQATNSSLTIANAQSANAGSYSVVVTNVFGTATSSNVTLTVNLPPTITSQPQGQTVFTGQTATFSASVNATLPPVASGSLQLWLKADAGVVTNSAGFVSQWQDQSGNANHASQTNLSLQPVLTNSTVLNGQRAIRFDGVQVTGQGDYLRGTNNVGLANAFTSFMVHNMRGTNVEFDATCIGVPGALGADRINYVVNQKMAYSSWSFDYPTTFVIPTNTARIWTDRMPTNRASIEIFDKAIAGSTNFTIGISSQNTPGAGYYVGGVDPTIQFVANGRNYAGDIAELIYYRGYLSEGDRLAVEQYLAQKYVGSSVLTYQWQFNGANIDGATNSSLTISNAQLSNAGTYDVIVCNGLGCVTSSNAVLSVQTNNLSIGLIAYYPFSGNAQDASGNGNNGNPTNVVFDTDRFGNPNSSANFSNNAFVEVPTLNTMPYLPVTYSLWFNLNRYWLPSEQRPGDLWSEMTLIGREISGNTADGAVCFQYQSGGPPQHIVYFTGANTFVSLQTPPTNQWVQVVFTLDASNNAAFYWNGQLIRSGPFSATQNAVLPFRIGCSASLADYRTSWKGSIDDVRVYNRALASNEVAQLYASEAPAGTTAPSITSQPQGLTVARGSNATLSVNASGAAPLTYQWQQNGANVSGATNSSLSISNAQLSDAGTYDVIVCNGLGCVTSSNAVLSVQTNNLSIGLIAYYPFSGNAQDASGNGNNGNPTNVVFDTDRFGNPNSSANFSNNAFVEVPTLNTMPYLPVTYSLWFNLNRYWLPSEQRPGDLWSEMTLIGREISGNTADGAVCFQYQSGGPPQHIVYFTGANTFVSLQTPPTNQWVQVVFTLDASNNAAFYWNGQLIRSGPFSATQNAVLPFRIGCSASLADYRTSWKGSIDDVRIYNRALASNEVAQLYTSEAPAPAPSTVPTISSYTPTSGPIGTVITINGSNFGTNTTDNIVVFGGVRAQVLTASTTQLTAVVPTGATYSAPKVTVSGLTAVASVPFDVTFPSSGVVSSASFAAPFVLPSGSPPGIYQFVDIDGDSKADLVCLAGSGSASVLSIYRNVGTNGILTVNSFAPRVDISLPQAYGWMDVGDMDGDGKLDVVATSPGGVVSVFRNQSTTGNVSFAARVDLAALSDPEGVKVGDIDGDGKLDIVTANYANNSGSTISVFRNLSSAGTITSNSFALRQDFTVGASPYTLALGDIDGDGKLDVIVPARGSSIVSIMRNTSPLGGVSFARQDFGVGSWPMTVAVSDLDADGKVDVLVGNYMGNSISIFKNNSTPGTISLAARLDLPTATGGRPHGINIADINGDGKPDVLAVTELPDGLMIWRNQGTNGTFTLGSLAAPVTFSTGWNPWYPAVMDLDGDGKPDVIVDEIYAADALVFHNVMAGPEPTIVGQPQSRTTAVGTSATFDVGVTGSAPLSYQWFVNGSSISGATTSSYTVSNPQLSDDGSSYSVVVTNSYGSATSSNAVLTVGLAPTISPQPASQTVAETKNATFTANVTGTAPFSYQWRFNGGAISGATNSTLSIIGAQQSDAGSYSFVVSSPFGTATSSDAVLTVVRSTLVAGNVSGAGSSLVTEPISLIAVGSENALGFSLAFDPAMLSVQSVALGSNSAGATLFFNTNNPGSVGVIVSLPTGSSFAQGIQEVALVTFKAGLIATQTVTAINFADTPTTRQVSDDLANSLPASYVNGSATLSATVFEGDVSPRPDGNQNVTTTDWVEVGRFVAGLDTIASPSEFQRADCAPRSSLGNGNLTVSDWVQAGRYAVGLDPLTAVGGPTSNGSHAPAQPKTPTTRSITLDTAAKNGVTNLVSVELNAQGNENAVGFSLTFDNKLLQFAGASVGSGAPGASLNVNSLLASNGTIGVALAMPIGQSFNAGTQECVRLTFVPASYNSGSSNLAFTDSPVIREVSDVTANSLSATYVDANLNVTGLVPPTLTIGLDGSGNAIITWPAATGFGLESASNPGTNWTAVSAVPVTNAGNATITQPLSGDQQYFRLRKP